MIIKRDKYLDKLVRKMNNGMVKVITGIRRSGKSFLLFNLFYDYLLEYGVPDSHIVKIALDDDEYAELRNPDALRKYISEKITDKEQYYVFLDEAQYAISKEEMKDRDKPIRLYGILNGLIRKKNVDVYITGSNSKFLSTDILTEFRGRGDEIHIAPLSFSEFYPVSGKEKADAWKEYAMYGGLPHILEEKTPEDKISYLEKLNKEIYIRDLVERYDIRNESGLETVMKVVASSVGSLCNPQKISDTFASNGIKGVSMPTVSNYLTYMTEAFIVSKAERYDVKGRKYISTPSKYYYADTGLRNALLNFRQFEETHIMENILYNELIYRGYNVDVAAVECNVTENGKHTKKQYEVDFVVNRGSERCYIQSAFAIPDIDKMNQEQAGLIAIPDSFKKIIVTKEGVTWTNDMGITIMSVYDFLLNDKSIG